MHKMLGLCYYLINLMVKWLRVSGYVIVATNLYYLTHQKEVARNTWVEVTTIKSDGKMAVNERTPDGYKVDGSGKWGFARMIA